MLCKIRAALQNYLWSITDHFCRARVCWIDCCLHREYVGLLLLDPKVTSKALLGKWMIHRLEPSDISLKILLRYRLQGVIQPKR